MYFFAVLCLTLLFGCGSDNVRLKGDAPSSVPSGIRENKQGSVPGVGIRPDEPLIVCLDRVFSYLLRGDGEEYSIGQSFMTKLPGAGFWRHPLVAQASQNSLKFYSQMQHLNYPPQFHLVFTDLNLDSRAISERNVVPFQGAAIPRAEVMDILGSEPRMHAEIGEWLILSEGLEASVRRLGQEEMEVTRWPASSGPYWNVKSLGDGWVVWDRLRAGTTNRVAQGVGRINPRDYSLMPGFEVPLPFVEGAHQVAMTRLPNNHFLWLEWREDWSVLAKWDPATARVERFPVGLPGDGKVLPTMSRVLRNGIEQIVLTDGREFRFLAKKDDTYRIVERFTPPDSLYGKLKITPSEMKLYSAGERLYLSGILESGERKVLTVDKAGLRILSVFECRDPDFIFMRGGLRR